MRSKLDEPDDEGFTIVELSVAMVLMAIVLSALGAFLITSVASQTRNESRARAVQLGNEVIEASRALPWEQLGFYSDDAGASACSRADGPAVSIPVPAAPAVRSARVPTSAPSTRVLDGSTYTISRCYRWIDDSRDGTGASDDNGPNDVKQIEVTLTWQDKGEARDLVVTALRAPTSAEVAPRSESGAAAFGIQSVTPVPGAGNSAALDAAGKINAPLPFTATTTAGVSTVQLRWTDANGVVQLRTLTAGATSTSWSTTLPTGTGPFSPVLTTFTLTAYSATGDTSSQGTQVSFSTTPGALTITTLGATPNSIDVNSSGFTATAFTVSATTNLDATSATLTYRARGGTSNVPVGMVDQGSRAFSYTFPAGSGPFSDGAVAMTVTASGGAGTATSSANATFVPPTVVKVALVGTTVAPSLCVSNSQGAVDRASTITVVTEGVGSADTVVLQFNNAAKTQVSAQLVSTSGAQTTWRYVLPVNSPVTFKSVDALSVSVTATRKSDNTQATSAYNSTLTQLNGNDTCPAA